MHCSYLIASLQNLSLFLYIRLMFWSWLVFLLSLWQNISECKAIIEKGPSKYVFHWNTWNICKSRNLHAARWVVNCRFHRCFLYLVCLNERADATYNGPRFTESGHALVSSWLIYITGASTNFQKLDRLDVVIVLWILSVNRRSSKCAKFK